MQDKQREYRHESVYERNRHVRHRHAGKVGDYKRYYKLERLHFAYLPFSHKPHNDYESDENYKCSDKNNGHTRSLGDFKKSIRENTLYAWQ